MLILLIVTCYNVHILIGEYTKPTVKLSLLDNRQLVHIIKRRGPTLHQFVAVLVFASLRILCVLLIFLIHSTSVFVTLILCFVWCRHIFRSILDHSYTHIIFQSHNIIMSYVEIDGTYSFRISSHGSMSIIAQVN